MNVIVVAAFREFTFWTEELPYGWKPWVLTKGVDLPNEGREASTFLHAMQTLRDHPPPLVAFVQGNPFDHCPNLLIELQKPCDGFRWLGDPHYVSDAHGSPHHTGLPVGALHDQWTGTPFAGSVRFAAGGQFMLPGALLQRRTTDDYKQLEEAVKVSQNAWVAERLWERVMA